MPVGAKRKRTAQKGGPDSKKVKCSTEDQQQYHQGVSVSDMPGLGCGNYLLGTPGLTFQSPLDGVMRFEVMSGTKGTGSGAIRLCIPRKSNRLEESVESPVFMVPIRHIEQFIIIDEPSSRKSTARTEHAYRVIIIPTAAVGASPLTRTYPKAISFTLPDRKADSDLGGKFGEVVDDPDETYRSLVTRVFNDELVPFKKSVIDVSSAAAEEPDARMIFDAAFKHADGKDPKKRVKGKLFFLETGILFHSQTTVLYLTAESTTAVFLVFNYEAIPKRSGPINLTLACPTSEPYYENGHGSQQSTSEQQKTAESLFISFHDIALDMSDGIAQYAKRRGIQLDEVEQGWYSLKKEEPMTGFEPRE